MPTPARQPIRPTPRAMRGCGTGDRLTIPYTANTLPISASAPIHRCGAGRTWEKRNTSSIPSTSAQARASAGIVRRSGTASSGRPSLFVSTCGVMVPFLQKRRTFAIDRRLSRLAGNPVRVELRHRATKAPGSNYSRFERHSRRQALSGPMPFSCPFSRATPIYFARFPQSSSRSPAQIPTFLPLRHLS